MKRLAKFFAGEDGAITVDWVLLTAAIVGLGAFIIITFIFPGVEHVDNQTGTALSGVQVRDLQFEIGSGS